MAEIWVSALLVMSTVLANAEGSIGATDVVVTMGCVDACPVIPGKRYLDWELDDPAGKPVEAVRPVRDEIEQRVRALLSDLDVPIQA